MDAGASLMEITPSNALILIALGFLGGTLSGFLGTGGAFILTPGMMALGVPGILAVGSNLAHKFGKAIVGSRKHAEMGNVDAKFGLSIIAGLLAGVQAAVYLSSSIYRSLGKAGSDLYISLIFVLVLGALAAFMIKDIRREGETRNWKLAELVQKINIPPVITFEVANVRASLWIVLLVGFATGYLAGTIGVGGFIGVPAMIYLLGIRAVVAAGTEMFLAIFSGAYGTFSYALKGFVDLRLVLLLYLGSILGVHIGAIATRLVPESRIRLVLAVVLAFSALSRAIAIPSYLRELGYFSMSAAGADLLVKISTVLLFGGASAGAALILVSVRQARLHAQVPTKERIKHGL